MGITFAVYQRVGYTPLVNDVFTMKVIGAARTSAADFRTLDEIPSVPKLFLLESLRIIFWTRDSLTVLKLNVGRPCFNFSFE